MVHFYTGPSLGVRAVAEQLQRLSAVPEPNFGGLLFELRQRRCLSQRELARLAHIPPSWLSEIENTRRAPPPLAKVRAIGLALQLPLNEQFRLIECAQAERAGLGIRVKTGTPRHVADLIRLIARLADELSPAQVSEIHRNLEEATMK